MKIRSSQTKTLLSAMAFIFIGALSVMLMNKDPHNNLQAANEKSSTVFAVTSVTQGKGGKVADFTFDQGGKQVKFSELTKGKTVFLNFWGTWCPPCRRELPDIVKINKELSGKKFIVIGVALERGNDVSENIKKVADFASTNGLDYINLIDGKRELQAAFGGIRAVPTTFIIKDGVIKVSHEGMDDYNGFMEKIKPYL